MTIKFRHKNRSLIFNWLQLICALLLPWGITHADTDVSGWVEKVAIGDPPMLINAKIDTGASHSSVHADSITIFDKNGERWVRAVLNNRRGEHRSLELPVYRMARIRQKGNQPAELRPVVKLAVCMGNVKKEIEINLVDRSNFEFPMLIGRSFLKDSFTVDVGRQYLTQPTCKP